MHARTSILRLELPSTLSANWLSSSPHRQFLASDRSGCRCRTHVRWFKAIGPTVERTRNANEPPARFILDLHFTGPVLDFRLIGCKYFVDPVGIEPTRRFRIWLRARYLPIRHEVHLSTARRLRTLKLHFQRVVTLPICLSQYVEISRRRPLDQFRLSFQQSASCLRLECPSATSAVVTPSPCPCGVSRSVEAQGVEPRMSQTVDLQSTERPSLTTSIW